MGVFENIPYTNFHEMNLDWLLQQMKSLNERMDSFVDEITADIIPIVQRAIEEGLIDVTYDSTNETVVLVPGAGVTSQHLAKFFQINNYKYPVADQTARNTINNWISDFNYTPRNMYKKAVFIGDSYLAGWTPDGDVTSWGVRLAGLLGLTVDTSAFIYSQGGAGFDYTNVKNFRTLLTEAVNDNRFDNDDIDLIVAGGGFNDQYSTYDNIVIAIQDFANIAAAFPNARIYVVNMCYSQYLAASRSTVYQKQKVAEAYYDGAVISGLIPFADCWKALRGKTSSGSLMMSSDDVHPNAEGNIQIARAIFGFITGGYDKMIDKPLLNTNPASGLFVKLTEDSSEFLLTQFYNITTDHLNTTSGTLNGSAVYIEMDPIPGLAPVTDIKNWGTAKLLMWTSSNYYYVDAMAGFVGGRLRLYPFAVNPQNNNYLTLSNIAGVQLYSLSMSIPAMWS